MPALTTIWGYKTFRWYQDRNLARTEEPALWLPSGDVHRLITQDMVDGKVPTQTPKVGDSTQGVVITGNPMNVALVYPKKYPDSDAAFFPGTRTSF